MVVDGSVRAAPGGDAGTRHRGPPAGWKRATNSAATRLTVSIRIRGLRPLARSSMRSAYRGPNSINTSGNISPPVPLQALPD